MRTFLILLTGLLFSQETLSASKLREHGLKEWYTECKGHKRIYRLASKNPVNSNRKTQGLQSLGTRYLAFIDDKGNRQYVTRAFEKEALETKAVWRFRKYKDVRLLAYFTKDASKVLKGDETVFEISEDLTSLNVVLKDSSNIKLECRKGAFEYKITDYPIPLFNYIVKMFRFLK